MMTTDPTAITFARLAAMERHAADDSASLRQLRDDVQTLVEICTVLLWRQTAARIALGGGLRGTHFEAEVDEAIERRRRR